MFLKPLNFRQMHIALVAAVGSGSSKYFSFLQPDALIPKLLWRGGLDPAGLTLQHLSLGLLLGHVSRNVLLVLLSYAK